MPKIAILHFTTGQSALKRREETQTKRKTVLLWHFPLSKCLALRGPLRAPPFVGTVRKEGQKKDREVNMGNCPRWLLCAGGSNGEVEEVSKEVTQGQITSFVNI